MKVLIIGQLPKEIGGNYTTGAANVVYELSKQNYEGVTSYVYATNMRQQAADKASSFPNQYIGYSIKPLRVLSHMLMHPLVTFRNMFHYRNVEHQNMFRFMFYDDNIRTAIKLVDPDVIHVNSIDNISSTRFALDGRKIPILLTCHGIFYRGEKADKKNKDKYFGNLPLADSYSGLTEEAACEFETILGIAREKVTIIPNGVDCKKFYYSLEERKKIRKELKISDNCTILITVASLQERKGQFALIKVLENLSLDYQYWIIGDGPDKDRIRNYIATHGLEERIKLMGYINSEQLYSYYSAADIYAHPSFKEGQALCEIEAHATGLRTLVNKNIVGTIANHITEQDYYVFDFCHTNLNELQSWVENKPANRSSRNDLDWSIVYKQYCKLYAKIMENFHN